MALGKAIETHTGLTHLNLRTHLSYYSHNNLIVGHNHIGDGGGKAIGSALRTNATLTHLDLSMRLG